MSDKMFDNYDVIIIGCGIAGAATGATLALKEGKKVLILERSTQIGGRATSFRGEGIRDIKEYQRALGLAAHTWYSDRTAPDLSEIVKKGLLNGYVLESGGRAGWYTNRGRASYVVSAFNKPSIYYPNIGFVWFDHGWKAHNVMRRQPYGWMTEHEFAETKKIAKRILSTPSIEAAEQYDQVSWKDFMAEITLDPAATEFYANVGTYHTVINDPSLINAGHNLKVILQSQAAGVHITNGAWSFAGSPGHIFLAQGLADAVKENGGQVVTEARVKKVIINNSKAEGVVMEIDEETREINAPVVISTVPPKNILDIIPEKVLPEDFVRTIKRTINAGVITAWIGSQKPMTSYSPVDIDERCFFGAPILVHESEGFRGHIPIVGASSSSIAPTCAPEGKHLGMLIANVLSEEAHDKAKVNRVINRMLEFVDSAFPGYRNEWDWIIFTVTDTALCWSHPEDEKPDVTCPTVEGLFFAGDAFGKRCNSGGIDAASHSGIVCAGSVTGKSYLDMLPEILR